VLMWPEQGGEEVGEGDSDGQAGHARWVKAVLSLPVVTRNLA
jgi:hypothetical protein